ncbi:3'-5' exonuclease [Nocardioides massiliensis]|uniref:DNA polymerase-3 subunit epsilon n=1 Tax=Nocardioides massiliensis TaxID=1325935 RepID=A0ABT9NUC7_9ACTN|nr:3'-5' exonuclease [Nocardioides massiliensis]MDP9824033.1 DNA polymerase-3 subunit epsilon [Nocardioides massiliensis]
MTSGDGTPVEELRLLAVDLETSGLSRSQDRILAIGWVPVDGTRIDLSGARRHVVRQDEPGDAVTIHGLTHDDLDDGRPLAEVLAELRASLAGRALLAHHAPFDVSFLEAAHRELDQPLPRVPIVCTLALQRRLLSRYGEIPRGALRLWRAREHYGLPTAKAHDALGDALACAELYLAQVAELGTAGRAVRLRDVRLRRTWLERVRGWLRGTR